MSKRVTSTLVSHISSDSFREGLLHYGCFSLVLSFLGLSLSQWHCLQIVCRKWKEVSTSVEWIKELRPRCGTKQCLQEVANHFAGRLQHLTVTVLKPKVVQNISVFTYLKSLDVSYACLPPGKFPMLKELDCTMRTEEDCQKLARLTTLQRLDVQFYPNLSCGFQALTALVCLKQLLILYCGSADIRLLSSLTLLQDVRLGLRVLDGGLAVFRSWPMLIKLHLWNCDFVTELGWEALTVLKVKTLYLGNCKLMSNMGLSKIASLVTLQSLKLYGAEMVDDEGMKCLTGLTNLRKLQLSRSKTLTDASRNTLVNRAAKLHRTLLFKWAEDKE